MNRLLLALCGLILATPLFAQSPSAPTRPAQQQTAATGTAHTPFAFRFMRMLNFNESTACVVLLPDGHYRREQTHETLAIGKAIVSPQERYQSYVYEGQLGAGELAALDEIINRPEFRALQEPARLHMSNEFLDAVVFRDGEQPQRFRLSGATDYKPNKLALNPLFDWWDSLTKRNHDLVKGAERNDCRLPSRLPLRPAKPLNQ